MSLFSELAKGTGEGWKGGLKVGITPQEIQVILYNSHHYTVFIKVDLYMCSCTIVFLWNYCFFVLFCLVMRVRA